MKPGCIPLPVGIRPKLCFLIVMRVCFLLFVGFFSIFANAASPNGCGKGQHWVKPHPRRAYYRGDGTYVRATDVTGHCHANPPGYDVWNNKLMTGRPLSWHKEEKTATWTDEERERILEALGDLPAALKDEGIDGIYRLMRAIDPANPASNNFNSIVVYDSAFNKDYNLAHVLGHELSHRLYGSLSEREKDSFRISGKWRLTKPKTYEVGRPKNEFLRPNGMLSPEEDFCDIVPTYFLQPEKLKSLSPRVFNWVNNHIKLWSLK
ncbi:MAG: hypothetical protein HY537_00610 [Deltaproteobacteria bacterium]|nr:hypothetical protein [Deltaproteobacteria bacterium]